MSWTRPITLLIRAHDHIFELAFRQKLSAAGISITDVMLIVSTRIVCDATVACNHRNSRKENNQAFRPTHHSSPKLPCLHQSYPYILPDLACCM